MFTWRHAFGSFIGAAVFILVSNIINHFFDLTLAASAVGFVVGLDTAFFFVKYEKTLHIHKAIMYNVFAVVIWPFSLVIAFFKSKANQEILKVLIVIGCFLGVIFGAMKTDFLIYEYFGASLHPETSDFVGHFILNFIGMIVLVSWISSHFDILDPDESLLPNPANFWGLLRLSIISYVASVVSPITGAVFVVSMVAVFLLFIISCGISLILSLFIVMGDHGLFTVGLGSFIGGLVGLSFGFDMTFFHLSLAMVVGGLVGAFTSWLICLVGQNQYVIKFNFYLEKFI